MGQKGTSKRKNVKQKAVPAAEGDSGSNVLKAINKADKIKPLGKAPAKGDKNTKP